MRGEGDAGLRAEVESALLGQAPEPGADVVAWGVFNLRCEASRAAAAEREMRDAIRGFSESLLALRAGSGGDPDYSSGQWRRFEAAAERLRALGS